MDEFVQGFLYMSGYSEELDGSIVKIIGRVAASDGQALEHGPEFKVRFGDGLEMDAFANELSPWYPT
jgi:hypothetical protein